MNTISESVDLIAHLRVNASSTECRFQSLSWSDLEGIQDLNFDHCIFEKNEFGDLESLQFTDCIFLECSFNSSSIKETLFENTRFYDADTEKGCTFQFAQFDGSTFKGCDLTLANFSRACLYRVTMNQCQATGIDFSHATSSHQVGNTVVLSDAWINDCNCAYANMKGANFCKCDLSDNRFSHSLLDNAVLDNTLLNGCDFHGVESEGLSIKGADLRDAQIGGLDVRRMDMTGVRINDYQQRILLEAIGMIVD